LGFLFVPLFFFAPLLGLAFAIFIILLLTGGLSAWILASDAYQGISALLKLYVVLWSVLDWAGRLIGVAVVWAHIADVEANFNAHVFGAMVRPGGP
jgi:hypothetical protein